MLRAHTKSDPHIHVFVFLRNYVLVVVGVCCGRRTVSFSSCHETASIDWTVHWMNKVESWGIVQQTDLHTFNSPTHTGQRWHVTRLWQKTHISSKLRWPAPSQNAQEMVEIRSKNIFFCEIFTRWSKVTYFFNLKSLRIECSYESLRAKTG